MILRRVWNASELETRGGKNQYAVTFKLRGPIFLYVPLEIILRSRIMTQPPEVQLFLNPRMMEQPSRMIIAIVLIISHKVFFISKYVVSYAYSIL
jgi:hypothetical protein